MITLKIIMPALSFFLISCDYYYSAMEYKDNDLLGKIYTWDRNINSHDNKTPIALEYDGFCFLKKNDTWVLLNGKSKNMIVALYEDKVPCITYSEKKWIEKICPSLNQENIQKIESIICK